VNWKIYIILHMLYESVPTELCMILKNIQHFIYISQLRQKMKTQSFAVSNRVKNCDFESSK